MKPWKNEVKWSVLGGAFGEAIDRPESKGVLYGHKDCKQLLSVVGLRCGTIMVGKIRSNFCQYTMLWESLGKIGIEGSQRKRPCLMVARIRSNFCQ